ncbi:MAG: nucleoside triphosphate pyrophosphohydrolase [Desulfobacterales bacterium]|nr:nucleoside triphosphate pyrophosphohydrolase [Desulfobacterales bacterium]
MQAFDQLIEIIDRLRSADGCPWDREQTFESIKTFLIEEVYEIIDTIDDGNFDKLYEELGDLQLQIVFLSRIAQEKGIFTIQEVLACINEKMIRRHPHVFGDASVASTREVLENWEKIKSLERENSTPGNPGGLLSSIAKSLPALQAAYQIGSKTSRVGFDWDTCEAVEEKFREEWQEYEHAKQTGDIQNIRHEIGDMLFTLANLARKLKIDPEDALRLSNKKFTRRFAHMEKNTDVHRTSRQRLEMLWNQAKEMDGP